MSLAASGENTVHDAVGLDANDKACAGAECLQHQEFRHDDDQNPRGKACAGA